jgi:hypothetical protein
MISCGFFPHNMTVLQAEQEVAVDGIQAHGNKMGIYYSITGYLIFSPDKSCFCGGFDPDPVVLCIRA